MNEPLSIENIGFMVDSLIDRAPAWTMIRELVMNGIEAAQQARGEKLVQITSAEFSGVPKMVIFNTGPGLSGEELKTVTNLSSSHNKTMAMDGNFGVGAKISSLANNRCGMRYRSCKDGCVSEVIIAYDSVQKHYVRMRRTLPDGSHELDIDVTEAAREEGRDLGQDWTEVMLLGNALEQDTVRQPYASEPNFPKSGVAAALYSRFFRTPRDVKIMLDSAYHRLDNRRPFVGLGDRFDRFKRHEAVRLDEHHLTLHFLHDPKLGEKNALRMSSRSALSASVAKLCLAHKDEMYSVVSGRAWGSQAPAFGIPFGAGELCVYVELDDQQARPSQYRERLIDCETGQDILPEQYAGLVREHLPDWVKTIIAAASPEHQTNYNDVQKELQQLLDELQVMTSGRSEEPDGIASEAGENGDPLGVGRAGGAAREHDRGGRRPDSSNVFDAPAGAKRTAGAEIYERAPEIRELVDVEEIEEKGLRGRAAYFMAGTLFVNGNYDAVTRMTEAITAHFAAEPDQERVRVVAMEAARRLLCLRVGKASVFALAKRRASDWGDDDMKRALSKESLSIAADDYRDDLAAARRMVRERLKLEAGAEAA